jgi:hypothetical protein
MAIYRTVTMFVEQAFADPDTGYTNMFAMLSALKHRGETYNSDVMTRDDYIAQAGRSLAFIRNHVTLQDYLFLRAVFDHGGGSGLDIAIDKTMKDAAHQLNYSYRKAFGRWTFTVYARGSHKTATQAAWAKYLEIDQATVSRRAKATHDYINKRRGRVLGQLRRMVELEHPEWIGEREAA